MGDSMIYLATPYTDTDPTVRLRRYNLATQIAAALMLDGQHVFSPITHCHPMMKYQDLPPDYDYWEQYDNWFLSSCSELLIVPSIGWENSTGVTAEIEMARSMGIPVNLAGLSVKGGKMTISRTELEG